MARRVEKLEFTPEDPSAVLGHMAALTEAHDGWINLLPGLPDLEVAAPTAQGPLASLFSSQRVGVTMATWMPPGAGRRGSAASLGIMHPPGRALPVLRQADAAPPAGWSMRQDHVRRGLVLELPKEVADPDVLAWAVRAATVLCTETMTGRWRADVHLPRD